MSTEPIAPDRAEKPEVVVPHSELSGAEAKRAIAGAKRTGRRHRRPPLALEVRSISTEAIAPDAAEKPEAVVPQPELSGAEAKRAVAEAKRNFAIARSYLVARAKERPITATIAALGVGLVLGALLA